MSSVFTYDLLSSMRDNPDRRKQVTEGLARVDNIQREIAEGKASKADLTAAMAALIPAAGFNFGLLIPAMFPTFPFTEPLDFANRPFMYAMASLAPKSVITLMAGRQVGKCATGETEVETEGGPRTLQSIFDEGVPLNLHPHAA